MKKLGTKRLIIIIAAVVVLAAAVVVLALGFTKGWFKKGDADQTTQTTEKTSYIYDPQNKSSVIGEEHYSEDGKLKYKINKSYADTEKKQLCEERYVDDKDNVQKVVEYDINGKITRVEEYENSKPIIEREYKDGVATGIYTKREFTDSGKEALRVTYNKDNKVIKKVQQQYEKFGNEEKVVLYYETDGNDKQISKTVYNFDQKGNPTKVVFYDAEGMTGYVEYEYNSQGNATRMNQYGKDSKLTDYQVFKYAEDGTVTTEYHKAGE